jgi:uncharacterized protein
MPSNRDGANARSNARINLGPLLLLLLLLLPLLAVFCQIAHAQTDLMPVPQLTNRIQDLSATLSADQLAHLEARLRAFEQRKGSQIAVLIVPSTQPEAIEQYAIRVVDQWKLGRKKIDDGALLLIAKDDRSLRIEVGYGLEGALNDATAKRIISDIITPHFKNGDFYGGIDAGIGAMIKVIDGEPLPQPDQESGEAEVNPLMRVATLALIAAVTLGAALRALFGRGAGAAMAATIMGIAAWFLAGFVLAGVVAAVIGFFMTLIGGRMGRGGWHRGGGGSDGGGFGGGGGGFGGGGGGFGGGGASGKW